jgi:hypothetical protein
MGRRSSLPDGAVVAGQSAPVTSGLPEQTTHGSMDMWPILRDPGTDALVADGSLDAILVELHEMALRRVPARVPALAARLAALGA